MKDPRWIFGFGLLAAVVALGFAFAFGKIVENTSYGLHEVLLILGLLAAQWANGMFGTSDRDGKKPDKQD
jgi:hypothetical protein